MLLAREAAVLAKGTPRVLDPFTGSGVVAIAAALAGADVTAVDISRRAVGCAWLNARLNGTRIRIRRGDLFEPVRGERFDLIAANPPYLPAISDAEPRGAARAWEAGRDGRTFIDRLCREAPGHLRPGGRLLLVHSSLCDPDETIAALAGAGLETEIVERRRGPLGPLIAARAPALERRGLLEPGCREEEVLVLSATRPPAGVGTITAGTGAR